MNLYDGLLGAAAVAFMALAGFSQDNSPVEPSQPPSTAQFASYDRDQALWNATRCFEQADPGTGELVTILGRNLKEPTQPTRLGHYPYPTKTGRLVYGSPESRCYQSDLRANPDLQVRREFFPPALEMDDGTRIRVGLVEIAGPDNAFVLFWIPEPPPGIIA